MVLGICIAGAVVAGIASYLNERSKFIETDNAYVGASLAVITSQVDGKIQEIYVHDTQRVQKGDILVRLDPEDAELDVATQKAILDQTYRHVRQEMADLAAAKSNASSKKDNVAQALLRLQRRQAASQSGAISVEEVTDASNVLNNAKHDLSIAQQQLNAKTAMVGDIEIEANPDILAAASSLKRFELRLGRTEIRAPVSGVVAQSHVQVGQQIAMGASLMSIVPVDQLYVDANFKESQLGEIQVGSTAVLTSDLYAPNILYHGHIEGVGGGTGSAFSIIPAQNATGNWIKVVQRLPVRIALDPLELARNPLRVGVSMNVSISSGSDGSIRAALGGAAPSKLRTTTSDTH